MHQLVQWLVDTIGHMGYPGIFLLMAMESSIIPVPSELVMPPAGYLAFQGKMNMPLAILCGTVGSLAGAYANYYASHYLGRPLILKYGKYVLIPPEKFEKVEQFFLKHGYPETVKHTHEHNAFIAKVAGFQNDLKAGRVMLSMEVLNFLKEWLIGHIQIVDKKYAPFLNAKGVG